MSCTPLALHFQYTCVTNLLEFAGKSVDTDNEILVIVPELYPREEHFKFALRGSAGAAQNLKGGRGRTTEDVKHDLQHFPGVEVVERVDDKRAVIISQGTATSSLHTRSLWPKQALLELA